MATVVTPLLTLISDCESTTGWVVNGWALGTDFFVSGSQCFEEKTSATTSGICYYDQGGAGGVDMRGKNFYVWMMSLSTVDTKVNGGFRIFAEDTSGNQATWYVGGSDTYGGGWQRFAVSSEATPQVTSGTYNPANHRYIGFQIKVTAKSNVTNIFADFLHYGTGIRVTTTASTVATWQSVYDADAAGYYGIITKNAGVYSLRGAIEFGSSSGTSTCEFSDAGEVVLFEENIAGTTPLMKPDSYKLTVSGNGTGITNFQLGTPQGTGSSRLGTQGCYIRSFGSDTMPFELNFANGNIGELLLYGNSFIGATGVYFGDETTAFGNLSSSSGEFLDNAFDSTDRIYRNISDSGVLIEARNSVVGNINSVAALEMISPNSLDGDEWNIINGYGFTSEDDAVTQTLEVSNHNFELNNDWLYVHNDKVWNLINPVGTNPSGNITFENSTNNEVNILYSLDLDVQTSAGAAIADAVTYIYEGQTSGYLPPENRQEADVYGHTTSNVLVSTITDGPSEVSYGDFALKVYAHGYVPVAQSITITSPIDQPVTLLIDSAVTQTNQNLAQVTANDASVVHWGDPSGYNKPAVLCPYEYGSGTITTGETVRVFGGSNIGTIEEEVDGDDSDGRIFINDRTTQALSTGTLLEGVTSGWTAYAVQPAEYSWEVNCNSHSMTETYDWLAANMASGDPTTVFIDAIEWGEDEQSQLVYKSTNYYTARNVNLEEGVWFSNIGAGNWNYMTSDSGYQYIPPTSYTFTLTNLITNSEVRLYRDSDNSELGGVENSSTTWQYGYTYTGDVAVHAHILHLDYQWLKLSNLTLSNSNQSIPVQQIPDRNYENP